MPFFRPKPDPIVQNILTGKISPEQPYIFYICHLGQAAHYHGQGINFAQALSNKIFGSKEGWFERKCLSKVCDLQALLHLFFTTTRISYKNNCCMCFLKATICM